MGPLTGSMTLDRWLSVSKLKLLTCRVRLTAAISPSLGHCDEPCPCPVFAISFVVD